VAIVGASGAGKSTLLHILGTLDRPTAGTVHFGGEDVFRLPPAELARFRNRSVGFVFQFHHLVPELTALENVMLPGWMAGREGYELQEAARELLDAVGVGGRAEHRPTELSGGEQQRVAVARALVNEPLLLLADEPTGNLDIPTGEALHDLLERLVRERGQTTVVATHNPRLAERANAVYRMADGGLVRLSEAAAGQDVPAPGSGPGETPGAASSGEGRERRS
jgi:lipoprotein-releasing system ATP-binding protein